MYPELWQEVQGYRFFSLCRDPIARFKSSMAEYSKHHGAVDIRFVPAAQRKRALFDTIEQLDKLGNAEKILSHYELTHFRPQWIYWTAPTLKMPPVEVWPLSSMRAFIKLIETHVGKPLAKKPKTHAKKLCCLGYSRS